MIIKPIYLNRNIYEIKINIKMEKIESPEFLYVRSIWPKNKPDNLRPKDVILLFKNANYNINQKDVENKFISMDINGDGFLDFPEIISYIREIIAGVEIKALFQVLSKGAENISLENLHTFINKTQGEQRTQLEISNLIKNYYRRSLKLGITLNKSPGFYMEQFQEYMKGSLNTFMRYNRKPNMNHPLSCYYISSSHNTYLKKHQLVGESSIMMYEESLKNGCKCIELDCWDGGNNPIIQHGYTLTSKIPFKDVISIINKYAFFKSPYPVIVSIENHCNDKNQAKMAFYMTKYFNNKIAMPEFYNNTRLPSPEQLKNKIIIKAKTDGINKYLKQLVFIECVKKLDLNSDNDFEMVSRNESFIRNIKTKDKKDFRSYTRNHLIRIYPKASRTNSSNYEPIRAWDLGAQIVALNWQTKKMNMWINEAFFERDLGIGYRLKPQFLLKNTEYNGGAMALNILLYSGRYFPKSKGEISNPKIVLSIIGSKDDANQKETMIVKGNGLCPFWNESFEFNLVNIEKDFLIIKAMDKENILAYNVIKVSDINTGYRNIPLKVVKDRKYSIKPILFCKIKFSNIK